MKQLTPDWHLAGQGSLADECWKCSTQACRNHTQPSFPDFAALFDQVNGLVYFGRMLDQIRFAAVVGYPQPQFTIGSKVAGSEKSDYVVSFTQKA